MLSEPCWTPAALDELVPTGGRARPRSRPRCCDDRVYFLTRTRALRFPVTPPPPAQPRALPSSPESLRQVAGRARGEAGVRRLHGFSEVRGAARGRPRGGRAHRRPGRRPARRPQGDVRAGRRHPRRGHGLRGRRARQSDQDADPPLRPGRGSAAAGLRARHQGAVGGAGRPPAAGVGHPHAGPSAALRGVGGGSSTRCRRTRPRSGSSPAWTTATRSSIRTSRSSASSGTRGGGPALRRPDGALRRQGLPEGGWHAVPLCHLPGGLPRRRRGGFLNSCGSRAFISPCAAGCARRGEAFERCARAIRPLPGWRATASYRAGQYPRRAVPGAARAPSFGHGLLAGLAYSAFSLVSGGWWLRDPMRPGRPRAARARLGRRRDDPARCARGGPIDRKLTFDKLTNVHFSGTATTRTSRRTCWCTIRTCAARAARGVPEPCTRFCPASVYEIIDATDGSAASNCRSNASNCVHCKTCDIMDPYQIIDWVPRKAAGGRSTRGCEAGQPVRVDRARAAAIAALAYTLIALLGRTCRWQVDGYEHYEALRSARRSRYSPSGTVAS